MRSIMKKATSIQLIVIMIVAYMPMMAFATESETIASGTCGEGIVWVLDENGCLTISGEGIMSGYSSIDEQPWYNYADIIESISICEGITEIGCNSFSDLNNVQTVSLPRTLTVIDSDSFKNCQSIKDITLPQGLLKIGDSAFCNCSELTQITIPNTVTSIGSSAFAKCSRLVRIIIPKSVAFIGPFVFDSSNALWNIHYEGTREEWNLISNYSAESIGLSKFIFNSEGSTVSWHLQDSVLLISGKGRMDEYVYPTYCPWFTMRNEISKVVIDEGVTYIGENAFTNEQNLKEVIIPSTVEGIGDNAFSNCENLTDISIPDNITELSTRLFEGCTSLTSIVLPKGLTTVGDNTFSKCASLTEISIPDNVTELSAGLFSDCTSLASVVLPKDLTMIGNSTFCGCNSLEYISIPDTVISIGSLSFMNCKSLKEISIPENVISIGEYAFSGCDNLQEVFIAGASIQIGNNAFTSDNSLYRSYYVIPNTFVHGYIKENYQSTNVSVYCLTNHEYGEWILDKEPTCTDSGLNHKECENCDAIEVEETSSLGHKLEYHEALAPTCTEAGHNEYETCMNCDYTTFEEIKALGHSWDEDFTVDKQPTCIEEGSKSIHCTVCEAKKDITTIEMLLHAYGEWIIDEEATCTESGNKHRECANCNAREDDIIPATCHTPGAEATCIEPQKCTVCGEILVEALGHDTVQHETKAPTCTEPGFNAYDTCNNCDYTTFEEIKALGHSWDEDFTVDKQPTCIEEGSKSIHCAACDERKDVTAIEKKPHTYGEWIIEKEATCMEEGQKYRICKVCDFSDISIIEIPEHICLKNKDISLSYSSTEYDGTEKKPKVIIEGLEEDKDFTVSYNRNTNSGIATITITGNDYYGCAATKTFEILPKSIENMEVTGLKETYVYKACPYFPKVTISGLCEGIGWDDYKVKYENNREIGTATVVITGTKNYTGQIIKHFDIVERNPDNDVLEEYSDEHLISMFEKLERTFNCIVRNEFKVDECPAPVSINAWIFDMLIYYHDAERGLIYIPVKDYLEIVSDQFINYDEAAIRQYFIDLGWYEEDTDMLTIGGGWGGPNERKFLRLERDGDLYRLYGLSFTWAGSGEAEITEDMEEFYDYFTMPDNPNYKKWLLRDSVVFTLKNTTTGLKIASFEKLPYYEYEGNYYYKNKTTGKFDQKYTVELKENSYSYSGKVVLPEIIVKDRYGEVVDESLYTVSGITDCKNVGTHTAEVTFTGNYSGSQRIIFEITECSHSWSKDFTIDKAPTCTESGSKHRECEICDAIENEVIPVIGHTPGAVATCTTPQKCTVCGEILVKATGHTYKDVVTRATLSSNGKIEKKCSKCGSVSSTTTIYRPTKFTLSATAYTYNGGIKKPTVTVKNSAGKTLIKDTDYTLTYASGRKYVGKYSVKISFKGKYSGSKTLYFNINPPKTSLTSLTASSKGFTAKWSKKTTQVTGYQIQYSTSSKFTNPKTVTITKNSTTYKKITKLTAKKKYYVRVRTYKTVNSVKYYSSWSNYKYVTTKS